MSKIQIVLICVVFVTLAEVGVASGRRFNQCPITACTEQYEPVCGSDGETYSNPCYLAAARCSNRSLRKVRDGECNAGRRCETIACTSDYNPVCGSDGKTYPNNCSLGAGQCTDPRLRKVADGECNSGGQDCPLVICTADYTPVCGSDGKTYSNECGLDGAKCENPGLRKVHDGEC